MSPDSFCAREGDPGQQTNRFLADRKAASVRIGSRSTPNNPGIISLNEENRKMNHTKKKTRWQQYIATGFLIMIGIICGLVMADHIESLAGLILGMYAALFFHIIVHEAGHLLFGLLTGYQFQSFRIASFMWRKENGRLKLRRISISGTGGQCLMSPPDLKDGKMPLVLYNLGGSIVNTAVGFLFLTAYLLLPDIAFLSPLLLIFAVVGFMIAMMNGIPMRMGTVDNDGYNAFAISKNREAVEAFWIQLKVVEQTSKGMRVKDMPAEWFAMPSDESLKNSMVAVRGVLACNRWMEEGKFEEADAHMAHLLEIESGIVGLHRDLLMCDRIFVELIGQNRPQVIENMQSKQLEKFMKSMKRYPAVLRTQYALALLWEEDSAKAEAILREFDKMAETYPYPQEIESERELMQIAEKKSLLARN